MPTYTYTNLKDEVIDPLIWVGTPATVRTALNRAARKVVTDADLRSTKRKSAISPFVMDDVYHYTCPTDLKDRKIVDIPAQVNRGLDTRMRLVSTKEFDRKKAVVKNMVAISDEDFVRKLLLSIDADDTVTQISAFDAVADPNGGTWTAYNDAANVSADTDYYVEGSGSIKFDLTGSATTAGIYNTGLTAFDISEFSNNGFILVWVYINSTTNLTNFVLEIGNDLTTNYYTQTVTTTNEGLAFQNGWNLLRFSFASMTENGTVDDTAIDSVRFYMTKTSGKSDDGYRVDGMVLHSGEIHSAVYYSKYAWQTSLGTWIENSTADTDKLNADTDEFDLFVLRGKVELLGELREFDLRKQYMDDYREALGKYKRKYRSEALKEQTYY